MPPSEVEKLFRAFAEERKRALPQFTPDGIPITIENKFDDAIYNYLYKYWKEQSGEYDPKKDVIPESEMNKMHPKTKNEKKFEQWLLQQYGMTKKEQRGYTLEGNLDSLWEIFSAADMVLFARGLPSIGKELAQLGKKAVDDVAEEAIEKTVKKEAVENTAKNMNKWTAPSQNPDILAKPGGTKTKINYNDPDLDNIRSLIRENEAAEILAKNGYKVEQNPKLPGSKNPDYMIENKVFDCYSPKDGTSVRNIASNIAKKIDSGQTDRIILNLDDWHGSGGNINELINQLNTWPIVGLKEVKVINHYHEVINIYP